MDSLITKDQLKAASSYLQGDAAQLDVLIAIVGGLIREYCGWHIAGVETTEHRLDHDGGNHIELPTMKLREKPEITINGERITDFQWSEFGMIQLTKCYAKGYGTITARMTHGYDSAPEIIRAVALSTLAASLSNPQGATQVSVGSTSMTTDAGSGALRLTSYAKGLLGQYCLRNRP